MKYIKIFIVIVVLCLIDFIHSQNMKATASIVVELVGSPDPTDYLKIKVSASVIGMSGCRKEEIISDNSR